jgi:histidyl-tRNA synthetase
MNTTKEAKQENSDSKQLNAEIRELKGTKVYMPEEQLIRERIVDVLKQNFKLYSYKPIETSILEFYDIAASKYGGGSEILKETYKFTDQGERELCLRYELTFKLAKVIAENPTIKLPFKRYEIGKVFRDGPVTAGRVREFTQCDVDVVGIKSRVADAELLSMTAKVFKDLGLDVYIEINERKLLFSLFEYSGIKPELFVEAALSIDKLLKIGWEGVKKELIEKGVSNESTDKLNDLLEAVKEAGTTNEEKIAFLEQKLTSPMAAEGTALLREVFRYVKAMGLEGDIRFEPTLCRGLSYYTGTMWEVFHKNSKIKSTVAAGGRWDDMISKFLRTEKEYPAVGMTFGLDVVFAVLQEKSAASQIISKEAIPKVLVIYIGDQSLDKALEVTEKLRSQSISCDISFAQKVKKAMEDANKSNVPFVVIIGPNEIKDGVVLLRDMLNGTESKLGLDKLTTKISRQ